MCDLFGRGDIPDTTRVNSEGLAQATVKVVTRVENFT